VGSGLDEGEQIRLEDVGVGGQHAVRIAAYVVSEPL
jgi:hypothetical protein